MRKHGFENRCNCGKHLEPGFNTFCLACCDLLHDEYGTPSRIWQKLVEDTKEDSMATKKLIRNPHGTGRCVVNIDKVEVHDLWHIAMTLPEPQQAMILNVWQLAHDLLHYAQGDPDYRA